MEFLRPRWRWSRVLLGLLVGLLLAGAGPAGAGIIYGSRNSTRDLYTVDSATGTASLVGAYGAAFTNVRTLAFDDTSGSLYGVDNVTDDLLLIDSSTGAASVLAALDQANPFIQAFDVDPVSGLLYGIDATTDAVYTIDAVTGAMTFVVSVDAALANTGSITFDAAGTAYVTDTPSDTLGTLDLSTGVVTAIGSYTQNSISSLDFDLQTGVLYGLDLQTQSLVHFNLSTGAGTSLPSHGVTFLRGLAIDSISGASIPEPSTGLLLALGSLALVGARRIETPGA